MLITVDVNSILSVAFFLNLSLQHLLRFLTLRVMTMFINSFYNNVVIYFSMNLRFVKSFIISTPKHYCII